MVITKKKKERNPCDGLLSFFSFIHYIDFGGDGGGGGEIGDGRDVSMIDSMLSVYCRGVIGGDALNEILQCSSHHVNMSSINVLLISIIRLTTFLSMLFANAYHDTARCSVGFILYEFRKLLYLFVYAPILASAYSTFPTSQL